MNKKAVIFDLDGTLLNTLEDLADAVNYALETNGMPVRTIDEVRAFVGNGVRNLMVKAIPSGEDNPLFEKTFADFKSYYGIHCKDKTGPYDGVIDLMKTLKERGLKLAIVSNKFDGAVKELDKEFFFGLTESAIGEMEGVKRKPAADTVNKALSEIGIDAKDAVYVGDSDVDIATARNANMECISVSWGFRDVDFLKEHGATTIIDLPMELLDKID